MTRRPMPQQANQSSLGAARAGANRRHDAGRQMRRADLAILIVAHSRAAPRYGIATRR